MSLGLVTNTKQLQSGLATFAPIGLGAGLGLAAWGYVDGYVDTAVSYLPGVVQPYGKPAVKLLAAAVLGPMALKAKNKWVRRLGLGAAVTFAASGIAGLIRVSPLAGKIPGFAGLGDEDFLMLGGADVLVEGRPLTGFDGADVLVESGRPLSGLESVGAGFYGHGT